MNFNDQQFIWNAYLVSNLVGLFYLLAAIKQPKLARLMFLILSGWASWFNYSTSHQQPEVYLVYAEKSICIYSSFINGWFKAHVTEFVTFIAVGQGLIALGMLLKDFG